MVQHDNRHVWAGLGFIVAALIIGGAIYIGLKPTHEGDASQQAEVEEAEPTEEIVAAPELIAPSEPETFDYAGSDIPQDEPIAEASVEDSQESFGDTRPPTPEEEAEIRRIAEEAGMNVTPHGNDARPD